MGTPATIVQANRLPMAEHIRQYLPQTIDIYRGPTGVDLASPPSTAIWTLYTV